MLGMRSGCSSDVRVQPSMQTIDGHVAVVVVVVVVAGVVMVNDVDDTVLIV